MARLIDILDVEEFSRARLVPDEAITDAVLAGVAQLQEVHELESAIRTIIHDPTQTAHGPTEIADIFASRINVCGKRTLAAFVLKGRSCPKVTSRKVAHQFLKLRTIADLGLMVLVAVGDIQDDARRDFGRVAVDGGCDYLMLDAHQCAKLLIAYEKICPQDGTPFDDRGICSGGHSLEAAIPLNMNVREKTRYTIAKLDDVSGGLAKCYSANVILDMHYSKDVVRGIVRDVTERLKDSRYYRNEQTRARWGTSPAHVVWLFVGHDLDDMTNTNWVCRTCWIAPGLSEERRPVGLSGNDRVGDIEIDWNDEYEAMKEFVDAHQSDKGEFFERLLPIKRQMIDLVDQAVAVTLQYKQGQTPENVTISRMRGLASDADRLYRVSGDLPFPPPECKEYDQACQNLFATVHDLFLPYTDRFSEARGNPSDDALIFETDQRYENNLQEANIAEKRIH